MRGVDFWPTYGGIRFGQKYSWDIGASGAEGMGADVGRWKVPSGDLWVFSALLPFWQRSEE